MEQLDEALRLTLTSCCFEYIKEFKQELQFKSIVTILKIVGVIDNTCFSK